LRAALAAGFHEASALDGEEFQALRGSVEFQELATKWKAAANGTAP